MEGRRRLSAYPYKANAERSKPAWHTAEHRMRINSTANGAVSLPAWGIAPGPILFWFKR
jgi:hypothetical protein